MNIYFILIPLSVCEGDLTNSASLITLHLNVDHPTGGFLTVGDGILSMEVLELELSTLINSSSLLEELHQQCVSLYLAQNLQHFPKNFLTFLPLLLTLCGLLLLCVLGQ